MPSKLTERKYVKDFLGLNRADTLLNDVFDGLIELTSGEVESITGREFDLKERTEYYRSYNQDVMDPCPQFIKLQSYPLDTDERLILTYSSNESWDSTGQVLVVGTDYQIADATKGVLTVLGASGISLELQMLGRGGYIFRAAPRGFRITYSGGYSVSTLSSPNTSDPLDEYGVAQVPLSLKMIVAKKVASDYKANKGLSPWTPEEAALLNMFKR